MKETEKPNGASQRQAEEPMQASLQLLPLIMNNIPQAVFWKDRNLVYLGCNLAFAEDAGVSSPEEVVGKTDYDMPWKDQAKLYRDDDQRVLDSGEPKLNYEEPQTTPDGSTIWLRTTKIPVREGGTIVAVLGMYEDITEYKKAQEATKSERERFQTILETVRVPTIISRLSDGIVLYANQAIADVSQVHLDKLIGFATGSFYAHPDDRKTVLESLRQHGHIDDFEVQFRRTDGSLYWALLSSRIVDYEGERCVLSTYIDISERKQAEEAVKESQARFQGLVETLSDWIWEVDPNGAYTYVSPNVNALLGYEPEEVLGKTPFDLMPPEEAQRVAGVFGPLLSTQQPLVALENTNLHKDGHLVVLETSGLPFYDAQGQFKGYRGTDRDITERKRAERDLLLRDRALASSLNAVIIIDISNNKPLYANDALLKMTGYTYDEVMQIGLGNITGDPEEAGKIRAIVQDQGFFTGEELIKRKDGSVFSANFFTSLIKSAEGRPIAVQTSFFDITERKQAEQTLQESEAKYSAVVTQAKDGVVIIQDNILQFVNQAMADMVGYDTPAELENTPIINYIAPESRTLIVDRIKARLAGQEVPAVYEARLQRKDGTVFDAELSAGAIVYRGKPADVGMIRDISERKKAEETLHESEERFRRFTEATAEGLVFHEQGKIIDANPAALAMFGLTTNDEFIGRNLLEFIVPDSHQFVLKQMQLETVAPYEVRCVRKDGDLFPVETATRTYKTGDRIIRATSVRDITERRQAEAAIQESQARFQGLVETLSDWIWEVDPTGKYTYVSPRVKDLLGYEPAEILGKTPFDLMPPEEAQRVGGVFGPLLSAQQPLVALENTNIHKDGHTLILETSGLPFYDAQGQFKGYRGIDRDITERRRLEQQIQTAFERRGRQVQLSTQVTQSIASASSLEELYQRVVTQVKEQFGYYHTQLLRYEAAQEAVVLVNGYGETGAKMLAAGHRLTLGEGLIGAAAASGETVLRPDLESDTDWKPNPLLPETKGEIAVPIKLGDRILGVLDVQSSVAGALGNDDRFLLEGLCGQIAIAIEDTQLRQEMTSRLDEINRLYLAMSHEGWQTYRETAGFPTGYVFDQGGTRPVENSGTTEGLSARIPLTVLGGEVIGTLAVAGDPQRPLTSEEENFLQQISEQLTLALESARLFEQTQRALSEVARRASELETVAKVGSTTSTVLDPDTLLQSVVDLTKERFGLYHAHIYLADEAWKNLILSAGAGEIGRKMVAEQTSIALNAKKSLVARAARERQAVIVDDVRADRGFLPNPLLPDTRSEMAVPLIVGDQVLGVFDVQSDRIAGFTKEDANIYTTLASQVAVALQNSRLYVEQAATVAQLRELDRLKTSFLANMSHELRTPLNSILGFADVILNELDGPLTENMANDLQLIHKNGQHLLSLINNVLDMAKIEAGKMSLSLEKFKLHDVIQDVVSISAPMVNEVMVDLHIEEGSDEETEVEADRIRIRQVMLNLVGNAIKFTDKGEISVRSDRQDDHMLVRVHDTGVGIPPDKQELVFQEFTQVDASATRKVGGTGLGLPISKKLIEMHGGRLWVESSGIPGEGSTFIFELPIEAKVTEVVEVQEK